jgi:hypothetical protein
MPDLIYEVHEYIPGRFVWHIHEANEDGTEGELVDWWNKGYEVQDLPTGTYEKDGTPILEPTGVVVRGGQVLRMDEAMERTELAAHQICIGKGARCQTVFTGGHPDPIIANLIGG